MAQTKDRKFVNGFFARQVWQGDNNNQLFSVGLKKDDFIKNIQALPADESGFINLTMGSQKADPSKMSLFEKEQKQGSTQNDRSNGSSTGRPQPQQQTPPPSDDDLPF